MKYRKDYQETHDIDWFFRLNGKAYHAASNGGMLPDAIDSANNRNLQVEIESLYFVYDEESIIIENENEDGNVDLSSFKEYARKGFISLDRTISANDNKRLHYHIVVSPSSKESKISQDLMNRLPLLSENDIVIK